MESNQYSDKEAYYFHQHRNEMIPFIPSHAQSLLEVGCGSGAFASNLKERRAIVITGIEPQQAAYEEASAILDRVLQLDVDSGIEALKDQRFDCIVFNDVLEHLVDPWNTLKKISELLLPGGCVVVSIPNARYMPVFKEFVFNADWQYREDGVMDRTHLRFFTKKSIKIMFESTGYEVTELQGINGIDFPWKYSFLNRLVGRRLEDTRYKQYACVARLRGEHPPSSAQQELLL